MQIPTSSERVTDFSQSKRNSISSDHAVSPTPSLDPCRHCGEDYCPDAIVETAQVARRYRPSAVTISKSTPSAPAKPLRKKRRLASLALTAKEQAATSSDSLFEAASKRGVQESKREPPTMLQLQIPGNEFVGRDSASPDPDGNKLTDHVALPNTPGPGQRSPERRKLDELHQGVKIVYKRQSPSKTPKRLSSFLRPP